jgi:cytochrome c5
MSEFDNAQPDGSSHIYAGSSQILEPDCLVCHAFSETHQSQKVALYDVDDGTDPRTYFSQTSEEVSAQIPAQGAPLSDHCLSCHGDGVPASLPTTGDNTQASPFINSGGVTGTLVLNGGDTSLWTNAGHNNATAIGCVGCHVGHGSTAPSLLDPDPPVFTVSSPAETDDYYTNFCINCHDADGPAVDIAAEFNTGTDYVVIGGMNGQTNNQRHDVTGASPPAVGCPDCHRPHTDNDTNRVRNPDTGAVLPTYSISTTGGSGSWSGMNYDLGGNLDPSNPEGGGSVTEPDYIQFCLVCHDGTPAGNSAVAFDVGSSYFGSRGGKQHGNGEGGDGSSTAKGTLKPPWTTQADYDLGLDPSAPYAAMNCSTCHGPHGTGNIYNLRTSITVGGQPMSTGGKPGSDFESIVTTTYTLPDNGSGQEKDVYGAWCTFCHNMNAHADVTEVSNCNSGHRHGGNNF